MEWMPDTVRSEMMPPLALGDLRILLQNSRTLGRSSSVSLTLPSSGRIRCRSCWARRWVLTDSFSGMMSFFQCST